MDQTNKLAKMGAKALDVLWRVDEWFPELSMEKRAKFRKYHEELLRFNKSLNLIGVGTIANSDLVHFADSIMACQGVIGCDEKIKKLYDFGSGNGFPGLIFAILAPDKHVVLVDSDLRKGEFLKHMCATLNLKNTEILTRRVEELPADSVDFAISRGFASLSKSLLITRSVLRPGGVFFHMKGDGWAREVGDIPIQLCSFWKIELLGNYILPIGEINYAIVKTRKVET